MRRFRSFASVLLIFSSLVPVLSCGSDGGSGPSQIFTLSVSPTTAQLATGATTSLSARVTDGSGATVTGYSFSWSSSSETVATVSASGVVSALTAGQTTITVSTTLDGSPSSASAIITVIQEATTLAISPGAGDLTVGETLQFSAEVKDAVGTAISGATVSWDSSEEDVFTVDGTGLATALAEGSGTLTATSGSATGSVTISVSLALEPFLPQVDTTLSGEVTVTSFTIPQGVTVTATEDLVLTATESVELLGTLTGQCVGVDIQATGTITIGGTLDASCTSPGAGAVSDVTIVSGSAFNLDGATINSGGSVTLRSEAAAAPGPRRMPSRADDFDPKCYVNNTQIRLHNGYVGEDGGAEGSDGPDGRSIDASCGRDRLVISGSTLKAADGGDGGDGFSSDPSTTASGGDGGEGGGVYLRSEVGISFTTSKSFIQAGDGGDGGAAEAWDGDNSDAWGGDGGHGGMILIEVPENGSSIYVEDLGFLDITLGVGGDGGRAEAVADDGQDATDTTPAGNGGDVQAQGGEGGANYPTEDVSLFGDLIPRGLSYTGDVGFHGGGSGNGGPGETYAGRGGTGSEAYPAGGNGGDVTSFGGHGGKLVVKENRNTDTYPGTPGNGASALLTGGDGGLGWDDCRVPDIKDGGAGGKGGAAAGGDGNAGMGLDGSNQGTSDGVTFQNLSNGGSGGNGDAVGAGGAAGADGVNVIGTRTEENSFQPGAAGTSCKTTTESVLQVASDPSLHEYYIRMLTVSILSVLLQRNGVLMLTGNGPWVSLAGAFVWSTALSAYVINASGRGTVAGYSNILCVFTGVLILDALSRVTGFTGTLTAGAEGGLPGGQGTDYSVNATLPEPVPLSEFLKGGAAAVINPGGGPVIP